MLMLELSDPAAIIGSTMEKRTSTAVRRLLEWVRSWRRGKETSAPILLPLTPEYDPEKHRVYFDVIEAALSDPKRSVRNIALTGSYGVGKSSILAEVAQRHKRGVIAVSLSTLGFPDDEPLPTGSVAKAAATKTNRIQKEIVKQLLYSQDPLKTPGSRYRRTTRFRIWRTLRLSAILALPVAVGFFLAGWTASIAALIPASDDLWWLGHVAVFAVATLLLLALLASLHNRFQIEKLGAGAATISLSAKSATYFDEYLDEIVYFFEVVKRDIVILEDIDRFDDAHIFETLRSLNSILNGAKQLKGRKIRFVYAIKDSIFDELGTRAAKKELASDATEPEERNAGQTVRQDAAEAEVSRANRTKFFDLVIPVVPFITHRSARDLLVQTLGHDLQHGISDELVDLTARYVADMRLIKNVRNEYAIFKRQIIDAGSLELSEDGLFAMVLYKSTHLSDFELIKLGRSNLDDLYRDGRSLVAENMKDLSATIRRARLRQQKPTIAAEEAQRLGKLLVSLVHRTLRHIGYSNPQNRSLSMGGEEVDEATLHTPEFWEKYASTDGVLSVSYYRPNHGRHETVSFARADVAEAFGRRVESAAWAAAEGERLDAEVAKAVADREFLSHADMSDLMKRGEFTLKIGEKRLSFAKLARKHLKSELAIRLLEAGYIDRNFTLYTSTFYTDRVSANATNYILKSVDPNIIDMHFELEPQDIAEVLRERGRNVLSEKAAYNVSFLDYLVTSDPAGLELMVGRLLGVGDEERELLLAYLDTGQHANELVAALAPRWTDIFRFLIAEAGVTEGTRLALVSAALRVASAELNYDADEAVGSFLVASYTEIEAFTSDETAEETAARVADLVLSSGVKLPSLAGLALTVERALVATGGYVVTRANLLLALADREHSLALDAIKASDEEVYARVLGDLDDYLATLGEEQSTIAQPTVFTATLEEVLEANAAAMPEIIKRSAAACTVTSLAEISSEAWTALADEDRFPITFANVKAYIDVLELEGQLARRLEAAGVIETPDGADETEKTELAVTILAAKERLPSPKLRAELARSLRLKERLEASSVPTEHGELIGWLILEEVVEDDAETFAAIHAKDVEGLAFAISKSAAFKDFMTTAEVTPANVGTLVSHALVPDGVKDALVGRFTEFTVGTPGPGVTAIARYAVSRGRALTFEETARLAQEGIDPALVLALLQHHLASVGIAELAPVLVSLGGEYEKLSAANGQHPRITNTPANRALVDRLKQLEVASTDTEANGEIKVNMKRP